MAIVPLPSSLVFFFFNDTATTEIYTLSLHDALPISTASRRITTTSPTSRRSASSCRRRMPSPARVPAPDAKDRKSTRLNSSHLVISYAVFCLKKKSNLHLFRFRKLYTDDFCHPVNFP